MNEERKNLRDLVSVPSGKCQGVFWSIVVFGAGLDLFSKSLVFEWLSKKPYYEHVFIEGFLRFVARENAGAAFSMMYGQRFFLITISLIAMISVLVIFYLGMARGKFVTVVEGMFLAGIAGNLYDRIFNNGLVRDFIDVYIRPFDYHWPTFNVADSLLCIAMVLFFIHSLICDKKVNRAKN